MSGRRQWLAMALIVCPSATSFDKLKPILPVIGSFRARVGVQIGGASAGPQQATTAREIPSRPEILAILRKVNSYQIANPVLEESEAKDPLWHPWPRVTWYTGVMAAWEATKDPSFLKQALEYGRQLQWQVGKEQVGPNRLFPIQLWTELYLAKRNPAMIAPSIKWLATPDPLSPAGSPQWYLDARESGHPVPYVDSLYGAPALALLARATGNTKYLDIMNAFFDNVTAQLFDKESGLYFRDTSFISQRTARGKKVLWSRGNGWAFAGIARVLGYLPRNNPARQRYVAVFRRMASELTKRQGADGLWRMNLDDPEQFPDPESSGSAFFCFGLAWGINRGVLGRRDYLPAVQKAWTGLIQNLSPEGKVLWGQLEDYQPNATPRESTHEFVTGAFLLAGSEVYRLSGHGR